MRPLPPPLRVARESPAPPWRADAEPLANDLRRVFGAEFAVWDGDTGTRLWGDDARWSEHCWSELARASARGRRPLFWREEGPCLVLALPVNCAGQPPLVAAAVFVLADAAPPGLEACRLAAQLPGVPAEQTLAWLTTQAPWPSDRLTAAAELFLDNRHWQARAKRHDAELADLSEQLARNYEEISLLCGVSQNLRLSYSDADLGRLALDWLLECVPAEAAVLRLLPIAHEGDRAYGARVHGEWLAAGSLAVDQAEFTRLVAELGLSAKSRPFVGNTNVTRAAPWRFPWARNLVVAPLVEGDNLHGWLALFNHRQADEGKEFGTVEARFLAAVASMLGIHAGNRELYRQQAELLASVVRAIMSAIDAKDPYTRGHSDRVARVAVRLGRELNLPADQLELLYMAALLHDVGKIGVSDEVLRKTAPLTAEEYEHIKTHPELGERILRDIRHLRDVLPVVLHHHEHMDGGGYPRGLRGGDIPLLARITAVADAFDAMSSDRPYRQGMPDERVDAIFRRGAGQQWDAEVVAAFFRARPELKSICQQERSDLSLSLKHWS